LQTRGRAYGRPRLKCAVDAVKCLCFVPIMQARKKPGWHERGYLPHFDANTLLQHIVFRTAGSLPQYIVDQAASAPPDLKRSLVDEALDSSSSGHLFNQPEYANLMQSALRYFDGDRYDLQGWCVMPNHVHVVLVTRPDVLLGAIVKSWKRYVTRQINELRPVKRSVFANDYFDRFVRNLKQAETAIHYVEANPVKAGLVSSAADYQWSSAYFRTQGWQPCHDLLPLFLE
jgi:putative transposase